MSEESKSPAPTKEGLEERAEGYALKIIPEVSLKNDRLITTREAVREDVLNAYIAGAQSSLQPSSPDPTVLVQALRDIIEMKLEPGEKDYKYAFNRCWHIATEALNNKKEEGI